MNTLEGQGARLRDHSHHILWAGLFAAVAGGAAVGLTDAAAALAVLAVCVVAIQLVAFRPAMAAYGWLLVCPLIVGVARGPLIVRPNEALLLLLAFGVGLSVAYSWAMSRPVLPRLGRIDLAMASLVVFGSVIPPLLRYGRGMPVEGDDLLYSLVFVKYAVLYAVFRIAITEVHQVRTCLKSAIVAGSIVAFIALFQVNGLFGVTDLLFRYYDSPFEGAVGPISSRATSTIASSFGLADSMAICLAITMAWLFTASRTPLILACASILFLAGCLAAGSFSGFIGCAVVVMVLALLTNRILPIVALTIPAVVLGVAVSWNGLVMRLNGFKGYDGLPHSWKGRMENLERFFWPELFSGWNWVTGVRPAARVRAPESWREWVYIESGHTWLLWTGGIAFLIAYLWFTFVILRETGRLLRSAKGVPQIVALSTFASTAMIFVLMLFDPHLTVRGTADLYFPLLAIAATLAVGSTDRGQTVRS